jgi:hypothetical protein
VLPLIRNNGRREENAFPVCMFRYGYDGSTSRVGATGSGLTYHDNWLPRQGPWRQMVLGRTGQDGCVLKDSASFKVLDQSRAMMVRQMCSLEPLGE